MSLIEAKRFVNFDKDSGAGSGPPRSIKHLLKLPEHGVKVNIPISCNPYQAFLAANRVMELEREEKGCIGLETQEVYFKALQALDAYAKSVYGTDRSTPLP